MTPKVLSGPTLTVGGQPLKTNDAGLVSLTDMYKATCDMAADSVMKLLSEVAA